MLCFHYHPILVNKWKQCLWLQVRIAPLVFFTIHSERGLSQLWNSILMHPATPLTRPHLRDKLEASTAIDLLSKRRGNSEWGQETSPSLSFSTVHSQSWFFIFYQNVTHPFALMIINWPPYTLGSATTISWFSTTNRCSNIPSTITSGSSNHKHRETHPFSLLHCTSTASFSFSIHLLCPHLQHSRLLITQTQH